MIGMPRSIGGAGLGILSACRAHGSTSARSPAPRRRSCGRSIGPGGAGAARRPSWPSSRSSTMRPATGASPSRAGLELGDIAAADLSSVRSVTGGGGTDFGVPSDITDDDRQPVTPKEATRIAGLVEAAWAELDAIAARTPETLRKGPRGGGRDRDKMLGHVFEADHAYAREIGLKVPHGTLEDRAAVRAQRAAVLEVLGTKPATARRWPAASGRCATPPGASPGTRSTTPGRWRTARSGIRSRGSPASGGRRSHRARRRPPAWRTVHRP